MLHFYIYFLLFIVAKSVGNPIKITVICFQKDEAELLPFWLTHYSNLFGAKNLMILDNESNNETQRILNTWQYRGVQVIRGIGPYSHKAKLIYQSLFHLHSDSDIMIYADADELIFAFNKSTGLPILNQSIAKAQILRQLNIFTAEPFGALKMLPNYNSFPSTLNQTLAQTRLFKSSYYTADHCKVIHKVRSMTRLDHGNHYPHLRKAEHSVTTRILGYIHYHNYSPRNTVERAIRNAIELGQLPHDTTIDNVVTHSEHLQLIAQNPTLQGGKKIQEILDYITFGETAFLIGENDTEYITLPTIEKLIFQ